MLAKIPDKSVFVIESSTTGKAVTRMISSFASNQHVIHMVAPPEKKASVKTDKRDCERIVKEDALGYLRRCYVPSQYIEDMRFLVTQQIEIGAKISRVKNQICRPLLERNMVQSEFSEFSDVFSNGGLQKLGEIELPKQDRLALALHLSELKFYATQHTEVETEIAKMAASDEDCQLLFSHPGINAFTAVAIKARIGDASRFPTKKHLCSYAGVVPGADNSGERESHHGTRKARRRHIEVRL